jgi:hypothetical protein
MIQSVSISLAQQKETTGAKNGPLSPVLLTSKCNDAALEMIYEGLETQILARPWFARVWIFQELLLSHDPWVQCGTKCLKWEIFAGSRS